jgi:S1-C subfamily serine protease
MIATFTHLTGSRRNLCEKFTDDQITVGRATDNTLCFGDNERRVSSHHAQISRHEGLFLLRDLGSTNGTMINGRRVIIGELNADDLIEFGAGGPLVRFGIEQKAAEKTALDDSPKLLNDLEKTDRTTTAKESFVAFVKRFLQQRKTNVRLTSAILVSMVFGAAFGIWLASSLNPNENFKAIAARNSDAVVFIHTEFELVDAAGNVTSVESRTGTGFVVAENGLIVTNRHLIRDWEYNAPAAAVTGRTKSISVVLQGAKRSEAIPATLVNLSSDTSLDVVIIKTTPQPNLPTIYGFEPNLYSVNQGDAVATIGYPLGMLLMNDDRIETSLSTGVVSRVGQDVIQLDLHADHGSSGSPVFNHKGEVIGILTSTLPGAPNIIFCTPIGVAYEMIKSSH